MKTNLQSIITLHEKMRGAYFFTPPDIAASRRWYEVSIHAPVGGATEVSALKAEITALFQSTRP